METLIIGEGSLTVHEVAKAIEKSTSFAVLQTRWREFAAHVGISEAELPGLELGISSRTLQLKEVPREILKIWRADKGTKATLDALCKALDECLLSDISDVLKTKFCPTQPVQRIEFILQEKVYTLEKLFKSNVPHQVSQVVKSYLQTRSITEPIPIIRKEVCSLRIPLYYIPRTLSERNELDEGMFKADATKEHIFLVKGAKKPELAHASGFKPIERSGNQLEKVTVHHILLDHDDDFHTICRSTSKPVHMIELRDNSFLHVKSSAGMDEIQGFIKENGVAFGEEEAVKRIQELQSPFALSIADSPGMGKTFLLAKLSALITKNNPKAVVLFITLQEIAQSLHGFGSAPSIFEAISTYATSNHLTNSIFQEMLKSSNYHIFLFLDGYDEVAQDKLDSIDIFIQNLIDYPNIKVIVTTRPHMKPRLENILQRLSFHILPFNESNQIEFLTKYWSNEYGANDGEMLQTFAKKCLKSLQMNMTDTEKDIAGIPLQCNMLAEVYGVQAKRASELNSLSDVVKITSFFEMYKSLMKLKFSRIGNSEELQQKYYDAHVHDAIVLLFPEWLERFKPLLNPREEVNEAMMYSIGLLEKSPSSSTPRFLHRTFAENLLAQFTVWNLGKDTTCVDFLYSEIFGEIGTTIDKRLSDYGEVPLGPSMYELKHPVIAYFVEMHLRDRVLHNETKGFQFLNPLDLTNISNEDICTAINACCCHDLENCFDLSRTFFEKLAINDKLVLRDKYFKHLPHSVVERTDNVSILQKVLKLSKLEFQVNVGWHVCETYFFPEFDLPNCTPLHLAVYHGKYNMVINLLEEFGQGVLSIEALMNCCLHKSAYNNQSVIENKLSIIESITTKSRKWLEEDLGYRKPILEKEAHVTLIKYLVHLGVDINTNDYINGTILHTGGDRTTYSDLVRWAFNNGFNLINRKDYDGKTPLMMSIERFKVLDDDLLHLFHDAGADFNAKDHVGDSILFDAINWTGSVEFVEKILDFGASLTHRSYFGQNAAHVVIDYYKDDPIRALELLTLFMSRGFKGLHQKNVWGQTPVRKAIKKGIINDEILKNFVEAGADKDGNSVLFYALMHAKDMNLIQKLLSFGENVKHRNKLRENAGHVVIQYQKENPQLALNILKLLESNGFKGFNQMNSKWKTPAKLAKKLGIENGELLKYLKDRDATCIIQ